jgi:hypothetical protein
LPFLFGVAIVPAVYVLARQLFDERTAFWSALLTVVNPFLIHFSQDARPYSLFLLAGIGSIYFWVKSCRNYSPLALLGFGLSGLVALHSHAYGMFLFPAWLLIFALESAFGGPSGPPARRALVLALCVVLLIYIPSFVRLLTGVGGAVAGGLQGAWIAQPSFYLLAGSFAKYFFFIPFAAAFYLVVGFALVTRRRSSDTFALLIAASVIACATLLPWLSSLVVTPAYVHRYTIQALSGVLLLGGWALARLDRFTLRIAVIGLSILTVIPLYAYYTLDDKDPWRTTAQEITQGFRTGDALIAQPSYLAEPLTYYLSDTLRVTTLDRAQDPAEALSGLGRVWFVTAYGREQAAFTDSILVALRRDHREGLLIRMDEHVRRNPWGHWMASIEIRRFDPLSPPLSATQYDPHPH